MRNLVAAFLSLVTLAATGCGSGVESGSAASDACVAAHARFDECGSDPSETPYSVYMGPYCDSACISECIAAASCGDLAPVTSAELSELQGCPPADSTGRCVDRCLNCATPLVLSFNATPVRFVQGPGTFDFGTGAPLATDWPSAQTPWLALDRNGNGTIDDAGELFGSATPLRSGGRASNGFIPLAELDSNGDGHISSADDAWGSLLLWSDHDGDRISSAGEIVPLALTSVVVFDLTYTREPRCDGRGNCEIERARFSFQQSGAPMREGALVDVHLRRQGGRAKRSL